MRLLLISLFPVFSTLAILAQGRVETVELLWEDQFDGKNPHFTSSYNENVDFVVKDGLYAINHRPKGYYQTKYHPININQGKDFVIEVKFRFVSGDQQSDFGLVWGYKDLNNHYDFVIRKDGYFRIAKKKNGIKLYPKNWGYAASVKPDGQWNIIRVRKNGFKFEFSINNVVVYENSCWPFYGNNVGFRINGRCLTETDYILIEQPRKINVAAKTISPFKKENLGKPINTKYTEVSCLISHDGQLLLLNRDDHPENLFPSGENDDVWMSDRLRDNWSVPRNIGAPINNSGNNYVISISPDRNTLLVSNIYNVDGSSAGSGYSISHWDGTGWELPKTIAIKDFVNDGEYGGAALAADGKVVVLTLQDHQSKGANDLYFSFVQSDNSWSKPENLGDVINGFDHEYSPFLAADGKSLYFASQSHAGYGGADIFVSRRLDDSWKNWSKPLNLGRSVNTVGWDGNFSVEASGEWAYLTSYSNSIGSGDIFRIRLKEEMKPEPVVIVSGRVLDSKTGLPVEASISYRDLRSDKNKGSAISDPKTGKYKIVLTEGYEYSFYAKNENYISSRYNRDYSNIDAYEEIELDLFLTPIELDATVILNNVFFEPNKAVLLDKSKPELDRVVKLMKDNSSIEVEIGGHTNPSRATEQYHRDLSENRAILIRDYLVGEGISSSRITAKGYGYIFPVERGLSANNKMKNMRVEFKIVKF